MHLCEIPEDRVPEIEIPTGIPMLFDFERRCVRLLDDGQSPAPRERYNFGTGGDLLFTPSDGGDMDPHVRLDDEFIVDEVDAECDKEIAADLEAVRAVAVLWGPRASRGAAVVADGRRDCLLQARRDEDVRHRRDEGDVASTASRRTGGCRVTPATRRSTPRRTLGPRTSRTPPRCSPRSPTQPRAGSSCPARPCRGRSRRSTRRRRRRRPSVLQ